MLSIIMIDDFWMNIDWQNYLLRGAFSSRLIYQVYGPGMGKIEILGLSALLDQAEQIIFFFAPFKSRISLVRFSLFRSKMAKMYKITGAEWL